MRQTIPSATKRSTPFFRTAFLRASHSSPKCCQRRRVLDAIYREDLNQTRDRNSAANHSILRRMALNAHNRMPFEGKKRKSLPKRELRATHDPLYLELLLSLMRGPCRYAAAPNHSKAASLKRVAARIGHSRSPSPKCISKAFPPGVSPPSWKSSAAWRSPPARCRA